MEYKHGGERYKIVGKLKRTDRRVKPVRVGARRIWEDEKGQLWAKIFDKWWKFPEQVEY